MDTHPQRRCVQSQEQKLKSYTVNGPPLPTKKSYHQRRKKNVIKSGYGRRSKKQGRGEKGGGGKEKGRKTRDYPGRWMIKEETRRQKRQKRTPRVMQRGIRCKG